MSLKQLIDKVKGLADCTVHPPSGLPCIEKANLLPTDVIEFFSLCGGLNLFECESYTVRIVTPQEVIPANPVIIGEEIIEEEKVKGSYDAQISKEWYIIADLSNSDYIAIDFSKRRNGRCYQAFWDTYPSMGDTPIIASSFTELLMKLVENKGQYWYFLEEAFVSLGDAYDNDDDTN
jgi:hypothetical protein